MLQQQGSSLTSALFGRELGRVATSTWATRLRNTDHCVLPSPRCAAPGSEFKNRALPALPARLPAVHQRPFVAEFRCEGPCSGTVLNNPGLTGTPAFAAQYSKVGRGRRSAGPTRAFNRRPPHPAPPPSPAPQVYRDSKLLAVADEEGYVSIVDTASELPTEMSDDWSANKPRAQWLAHRNAVFDIAWCNVGAAAAAAAAASNERAGARAGRCPHAAEPLRGAVGACTGRRRRSER